jgi:hypothetical protein
MQKQQLGHDVAGASMGRLYLFTFVQEVTDEWLSIPHDSNARYRVTLFLLLHGLYEARARFNFEHGDIHAGNIMMELARDSPVVVRYGQMEAELQAVFTPRLIDYGKSTTTSHAGPGHATNDIQFVQNTFWERLEADANDNPRVMPELRAFNKLTDSEAWYWARSEFYTRGPDAILAILADGYFEVPEIRRRQVKRAALNPIERCFSCCSTQPAFQIQHRHAAPKSFCDAVCYQRIRGICQFIK